MARYTTVLLFLLICCEAVTSAEIAYLGARPARSESLEAVVNRLSENGVDWAAVCDSVVLRLQADGYVDASAQWRENRIEIAAGPLYVLQRLVVDDTLAISSRSYPFTEAGYHDLAATALQRLGARGHYFARLVPDSVVTRDAEVTVYVHGVPGPNVTIARCIFSGLRRSKSSVLQRYVSVREGDTLTEDVVRRAETQADAIPFVNHVPPAVIRPLPGYTEADIELRFTEKRQVEVFGGLGYISEEPSYMVWNLDLRLTNLFGDGRSISLASERFDRKRQRLDLAYGQPLFLAGIGYLDAKVATRDFRDDFYEFTASGRYALTIMPGSSAALGLGWKRVDPPSSTGAAGYVAYSLEFSVSRSTLDNVLNPESGFRGSASLAYAHRRYRNDAGAVSGRRSVFNETHSRLSLAVWSRLSGWLIGHAAIIYSGIETGEVQPPLSELILVGGPGTLRGYRNGQFAVQRTAYGTLEPHVRFSQGYAFVFCDAAYLNRRLAHDAGGSTTEELFRAGYGVGLALDDGIRSVRLSFAWGEDAKFSQPRLSVEFTSDL
jgi:outer membrane protein assembly factor BamA